MSMKHLFFSNPLMRKLDKLTFGQKAAITLASGLFPVFCSAFFDPMEQTAPAKAFLLILSVVTACLFIHSLISFRVHWKAETRSLTANIASLLLLILAVILAIGLFLPGTSPKFTFAWKAPPKENGMVTYESGVYHDKDWTETEWGTYKGTAIPDKETALRVATAIFDGIEKNEETKAFTAQEVFFDTEDEIWLVFFWRDPVLPDGSVLLGYSCNIALQKSDGKVLRIWFQE